MEERGQYITLLCLQHQSGHLSEKAIRLTLGISTGNAPADVLAKFRQDSAGLWYNDRLDKEIARRQNFSATQSQKAHERWEKHRSKKERRKNKDAPASARASATAMPGVNGTVNVNGTTNGSVITPFDSEKFHTVWGAWLEYRKQIKKPYRSVMSAQAALKNLAKYDEATAIAMIENSIANGWQGIFELQHNGKRSNKVNDIQHSIAESIKRTLNGSDGPK